MSSGIRRILTQRRQDRTKEGCPSSVKTVLIETHTITIGLAACAATMRGLTTVTPKYMENLPKSARSKLVGAKTLKTNSLRKRDEMFHELSMGLLLSSGEHKNIIRFHPYFFISPAECGFLMEAHDTTLFNYSQSLAAGDLGQTQSILLDCCTGLRYVHDLGFVHNDVRSENILVQIDRHGNGVGKVSDFGAAMKTARRISKKEMQPYITAQYCSPEMMATSEEDAESVVTLSCKSDVWAIGVTTWNLYARSFAWIKAIDNAENVHYAAYVRWLEYKCSHRPDVEAPRAFKNFSHAMINFLCHTVQPLRKNRWEMSTVIEYMAKEKL